MAVYIDRAPHQALLVMWGRAPDAWWGCVQFRQRVRIGDHIDELPIAAWLPAASIMKPGWSSGFDLTRVDLDIDRTSWPAPSGWPSWYAGVWPSGDLALPPGCAVDRGAAWRRRR